MDGVSPALVVLLMALHMKLLPLPCHCHAHLHGVLLPDAVNRFMHMSRCDLLAVQKTVKAGLRVVLLEALQDIWFVETYF